MRLKALGPDFTNTALEGEGMIDPDKISDGMYHVTQVALTDRAKNTTYYDTKAIPNIYLKGNLGTNKRAKDNLDQSQIKIKTQPAIEGYQGVELVLPISHSTDLESMHLTWDVKSMDHPVTHVCSGAYRYGEDCFLSKSGDPEIRIRSYFWKQYPTGRINLSSIYMKYAASKTNANQSYTYPITREIGFEHNTGHDSASLLNLDVNLMKLSVEKGDNEIGGDTSIKFDLPINSVEHEDYSIMVNVMGPSGKSILHIANKRNSKIVNGQLIFSFPLYINQEKGIYMVESIEIQTKYQIVRALASLLDQGGAAVVKIKLKERGIKKSFKVLDDRSVTLD